jgi:hypothetical protein
MTRPDFITTMVITGALCALVGAIKLAASDDKAWQRFRVEHHCEEVDRQHPPAGIETTPGKTTWVCDGDQVYVRNGD